MRKIITTTEKYNEEGKLIEKIVKEETIENESKLSNSTPLYSTVISDSPTNVNGQPCYNYNYSIPTSCTTFSPKVKGENKSIETLSYEEKRENLADIVNDFFGCDASYYDIHPLEFAEHLLKNNVDFINS